MKPDEPIDIETLIEAWESCENPDLQEGELWELLRGASDEGLEEWEGLLLTESNRLNALLEDPDPFLLDLDKQVALEERYYTVGFVLSEVREEMEKRLKGGRKEVEP